MYIIPDPSLWVDRPDVTCAVFKGRLDAMLYNIRHGKYFDDISLPYEIRVIEYQIRGNKPPIVTIFFYLFNIWHTFRFTTLPPRYTAT